MYINYQQTKAEVLDLYDKFLEIIAQAGLSENEKSMMALKNQAENIRKDRFMLMIAGEAKSGKSTFINAYLGQEILPMDVKQCTSAIVQIRCDKVFTLTATYANGNTEKILGDVNIKRFLRSNAALNDEYRDIPLSAINNEVLIKYRGKINNNIVNDLISGVQSDNVYGLSPEDYAKKIKDYIAKNKDNWAEIVTKMEITYPFEDESLRGIEIVDSPGVNAQGRLGNITNNYIENANAIMFLKPITGAALESNSFKKFLENESIERNGKALFLILTRAANETPENLQRLQKEALNLYGKTIHAQQIIYVDSKVELFINHIINMTVEEIETYIKELEAHKQLDAFIENLWYKSKMSKAKFLEMLKEKSNFSVVGQSLNRFGRKTHYLALSEFLGRMEKIYRKISDNIEDQISLYQEKAQDPIELAKKIGEIKKHLEDIKLKMNETVDAVYSKYTGDDSGIITSTAEKEIKDLKDNIQTIKNNDIDLLEKLSLKKSDKFKSFQDEMEKNIVAECNKALIVLSEQNKIKYTALEPDFNNKTFSDIKKSTESGAYEIRYYTTGKCFKKTHSKSVYSQPKHFNAIKNNILFSMEKIKSDAVKDLIVFAGETTDTYKNELHVNAEIKKEELNRIEQEKKTAEEIQKILIDLRDLLNNIEPLLNAIQAMKGGIDSYI